MFGDSLLATIQPWVLFGSIPTFGLLVQTARVYVGNTVAEPSNVLRCYNVSQVIMSAVLLTVSLDSLHWMVTNRPTDDTQSFVDYLIRSDLRFMFPRFVVYQLLFQFAKVYEWMDTIFLVIRGRPVKFIHGFHHATISLAFFVGSYTGSWLWIANVNSFIHILMYLYYANLMRGYNIQQLLTSIQVVQIFGSVCLEIYTLVYPIRPECVWYSVTALAIASVYLVSFLHYYTVRYMEPRNRKIE
jgi:hypothetical protein